MNKRVHQIAKERGLPAKDVLERLQAAGVKVKAVSSSVDEADARRVLDGGDGQAPRGSARSAADGARQGRAVRPAPRRGGNDRPHRAANATRARTRRPLVPTLPPQRSEGSAASGPQRASPGAGWAGPTPSPTAAVAHLRPGPQAGPRSAGR